MRQLIFLLTLSLAIACNNNPSEDILDESVNRNSTNSEQAINADTSLFAEPSVVHEDKAPVTPAEDIEIRQTYSFSGFTDFFKQFEKTTQTIKINAANDSEITCQEGTVLRVKGNSFVTSDGQPVEGEVTLRVREYYSTSDILLANLTTTSKDKILETGGMLYLEARSGGQKCELRPGTTMDIEFPTSNRKEGMQLFNGTRDGDGRINWTTNQSVIYDLEPVYGDMCNNRFWPELATGTGSLADYLSDSAIYPRAAMEQGIQGTVYVSFTVAKNGQARYLKIIRSVHPLLDEAALDLIRKLPDFKPCRKGDNAVDRKIVLPVNFSLGGRSFNTDDAGYARNFEQAVDSSNLASTKMSSVSRYLLSTSQLGWINCDRFYKSNAPRQDYFVNLDGAKAVDIKMVFRDISSVLTGSVIGDKYVFSKVPQGQKVTLVALKFEDGQYQMAVQDTRISSDAPLALSFKPVTMEGLRREMEKLSQT